MMLGNQLPNGINASPMSGHDLPYLTTGPTFPNTTAVRHQGLRSRSSQHLITARSPAEDMYGLGVAGPSSASAVSDSTGQYGNYAMGRSQSQGGVGLGAGQMPYVEDKSQRVGLRRVRDPMRDLTPQMNQQNIGRRADSSNPGAFLSVSEWWLS